MIATEGTTEGTAPLIEPATEDGTEGTEPTATEGTAPSATERHPVTTTEQTRSPIEPATEHHRGGVTTMPEPTTEELARIGELKDMQRQVQHELSMRKLTTRPTSSPTTGDIPTKELQEYDTWYSDKINSILAPYET